jgi:hypothetical protein
MSGLGYSFTLLAKLPIRGIANLVHNVHVMIFAPTDRTKFSSQVGDGNIKPGYFMNCCRETAFRFRNAI